MRTTIITLASTVANSIKARGAATQTMCIGMARANVMLLSDYAKSEGITRKLSRDDRTAARKEFNALLKSRVGLKWNSAKVTVSEIWKVIDRKPSVAKAWARGDYSRTLDSALSSKGKAPNTKSGPVTKLSNMVNGLTVNQAATLYDKLGEWLTVARKHKLSRVTLKGSSVVVE